MVRATKRKAAAPKATSRTAAASKAKASVKAGGKATAKRATGSLAASKRKADDVYDFPEDDTDDDKFSIVVKWVNRGQTTSEWTFSMSNDSTVENVRDEVIHHTDGVFKAPAIMLKYKNKNLSDMNQLLKDAGIRDGAEIVLLLNHEAQVPAAPTMMHFPGEPVKKAKKEKREGQTEKKRERFTKDEAESLIAGVKLYGLGQWAQIKASYFREDNKRSGVDLKDKWRNLVLASQRPPGFKFRVDYLNESGFLEQVTRANIEAMAKAQQ